VIFHGKALYHIEVRAYAIIKENIEMKLLDSQNYKFFLIRRNNSNSGSSK